MSAICHHKVLEKQVQFGSFANTESENYVSYMFMFLLYYADKKHISTITFNRNVPSLNELAPIPTKALKGHVGFKKKTTHTSKSV